MLGTLFSFFINLSTNFSTFLANTVIKWWSVHRNALSTWTAAAAVILGWIAWSIGQLGPIIDATLTRLTNIAALVANVDPATVTNNDYFTMANTFFPVDILFSSIVLYFTLASLVFVVRVVIQFYKLIPFKAT